MDKYAVPHSFMSTHFCMPFAKNKTNMRLFRLFLVALVLSSLLCVGTSAKVSGSASSASNRVKSLPKIWKNIGDFVKNIFDSIQHGTQSSSASPSAREKIEGLAKIKQYLYEIGYMGSPPGPGYTDFVDNDVRQALKDYQVFFNLSVTGSPDNSTLQQMSLPRCGVPDRIPTQTPSQNLSWPEGNNSLKGKKNITYGFLPESEIPTDMMVVIEDAFHRWSNATAMNFTETTVINAADITIGFYLSDDLFNSTMYGDVVIEFDGQHNVTVGAIRLDAGKYWVLPSLNDSFTWRFGAVDLGTAVMHHIGHLVGLAHLSAKDAVMYPYILPSRERKVKLSNDDVQSLQKLNASSGDRERNAVVAALSSLLVGLAYTVLFI